MWNYKVDILNGGWLVDRIFCLGCGGFCGEVEIKKLCANCVYGFFVRMIVFRRADLNVCDAFWDFMGVTIAYLAENEDCPTQADVMLASPYR